MKMPLDRISRECVNSEALKGVKESKGINFKIEASHQIHLGCESLKVDRLAPRPIILAKNK
jgi:hypothetical protein